MEDANSVLQEMFESSIPEQFQEAVLRVVFDGYAAAYSLAAGEYEKQEFVNTIGVLRRGKIEQGLRHAASRFPALTFRVDRYPADNPWFTTSVFGKRIVLTQSRVLHPGDPLKHAIYRDECANLNRQKTLFDLSDTDPRIYSQNRVFAVLIHGRGGMPHGLPGFAQIRFPTPKLAGYYTFGVDLFRKYPHIVAGYLPTDFDQSQQPKPLDPELNEGEDIA